MSVDRSIGNYHDSSNARIRKIGKYVGPVAYVANGDPLTPAEIGLGVIEAIFFTLGVPVGLATQYQLTYDAQNQTVIWFSSATGVEVVAGTDLSAVEIRFEAIGH